MGRIIVLPFQSDLETLYRLGINEAVSFGGRVSGNKTCGEFSVSALGGKFEGSFKVTGSIITITLTKKPILIPYTLIETFLRKYVK
jgi:hypothetical protein